MKLQILIILLLMQACAISKPEVTQQPKVVAAKNEKRIDAGVKELSKSQKEQVKTLLAEIRIAIDAYKNTDDSTVIAEKCDRVTNDTEKLATSLPAGFFRNSLQQGSEALNLAYLFRFEKKHSIVISPELKKEAISTYKVGHMRQEEQADKIFDFAQVHFDIASRLASDAGITP